MVRPLASIAALRSDGCSMDISFCIIDVFWDSCMPSCRAWDVGQTQLSAHGPSLVVHEVARALPVAWPRVQCPHDAV